MPIYDPRIYDPRIFDTGTSQRTHARATVYLTRSIRRRVAIPLVPRPITANPDEAAGGGA